MKNKLRLKKCLFSFILFFIVFLSGKTQTRLTDSLSVDTLNFREYLYKVGKNNLGLLATKYHIKIAEAQVAASKVMPDPEIAFEAKHETYTLAVNYNLELGHKRAARVKVAQTEAEITRLSVENYFMNLRAEAANAYFTALTEAELVKIKKRSLENMKQIETFDKNRFSVGEISENEARQSTIEANSLKNEIFKKEGDYQSALALLNFYLGNQDIRLEVPSFLDEKIKKEYYKDYSLDKLLSLALNHRVDLMQAQKSTELTVNQLRLVQEERKIDIGLSVGYERDWKGIINQRNMLQGGISIPLKFSNRNKGELWAAKYAIEQSENEEQQVEIQVKTEVIQIYYRYESAKKQIKQYESGLISDSKKVLEGITYKYKRGEASILEVLVAQRTYNDLQEQYLEALNQCFSTLIELQKACGIWEFDL